MRDLILLLALLALCGVWLGLIASGRMEALHRYLASRRAARRLGVPVRAVRHMHRHGG